MSFERYKNDIEKLVAKGYQLYIAMLIKELDDEAQKKKLKKEYKDLPDFKSEYQSWYSEAIVCVSQLLPDRIDDLIAYYKPPNVRKDITPENYTVSDNLKGLNKTLGNERIFGPGTAIPAFEQQLNIVSALQNRFESSLFDIQALVQADLFENELDASEELNKKGFHRGAGAVAGVVLEGHLRKICEQHKIDVRKNSTLGTINDQLKENGVLDVTTWRFIQHLIDLRNLCDHKKAKEPTPVEIEELIAGVRKVTKTVY